MHACRQKQNKKPTIEWLGNTSLTLTGVITLHERVRAQHQHCEVPIPHIFYVLRKVSFPSSHCKEVADKGDKPLTHALLFSKRLPSNLQYPESLCFQKADFHLTCTRQPKSTGVSTEEEPEHSWIFFRLIESISIRKRQQNWFLEQKQLYACYGRSF